MKKQLKIFLILVAITLSFLTGIVITLLALQKVEKSPEVQTKTVKKINVEELKSLIPTELIFFENQLSFSLDGKYLTFLTTDDLGMRNSKIWIANADGSEMRILLSHDSSKEKYSWISNPTWSPKSDEIIYIKNNNQIWITDLSGYENRLISNDKKVYTSIGYGGKTYLKWNEDNTIEFINSGHDSDTLYSLDLETKEIDEAVTVDGHSLIENKEIKKTTHFIQRDPIWKKDQLGTCKNQTIGSAGCAITSLAMLFSYHGLDINPQKLDKAATEKKNWYVNGCDIRWDLAVNYAGWSGAENDENIQLEFQAVYHYDKKPILWERLNKELDLGNPAVIGMDQVGPGHWVLVTHREFDEDRCDAGSDKDLEDKNCYTYYISDPWYKETDSQGKKTLKDYNNNFQHLVVYRRSGD